MRKPRELRELRREKALEGENAVFCFAASAYASVHPLSSFTLLLCRVRVHPYSFLHLSYRVLSSFNRSLFHADLAKSYKFKDVKPTGIGCALSMFPFTGSGKYKLLAIFLKVKLLA